MESHHAGGGSAPAARRAHAGGAICPVEPVEHLEPIPGAVDGWRGVVK